MIYLSKGAVLKECSTNDLYVTLCGIDYALTGLGAKLWLTGRFQPNETDDERELRHLAKLQELGLVESSEERGAKARYILLTRCIICPTKSKRMRQPLTLVEAKLWKWISEAGLRLTIGELVKLFEFGINPTSNYLGAPNAQTLTLELYQDDLLFDTTLELKMENASSRDAVVNAVIGLLRKKRILLT